MSLSSRPNCPAMQPAAKAGKKALMTALEDLNLDPTDTADTWTGTMDSTPFPGPGMCMMPKAHSSEK